MGIIGQTIRQLDNEVYGELVKKLLEDTQAIKDKKR